MTNSAATTPDRSIVLAGSEWVLVKKALDEVRDAARDAFGDYVYLPFDPKDPAFAPAMLLDEIASPSLDAVHKLVVVEAAEGLAEDLRDELITRGRKLPRWVTLVLRFRDARAGAAFVRRAGKGSHWKVRDCSESRYPKQPALVKWVRDRANARDKQIQARGAQLVVETCAPSLTALDNEVEKLCLFVGDRKRISVDDVAQVVAGGVGVSVFALADAVTERRAADAIRAARDLTVSGAPIEMVIPVLAKAIRRMWHLKRSRGGTEFEGAAKKDFGRCPTGIKQRIAATGKKWKTIELMYALETLLDADYARKTSHATPEVILETLVPCLLTRVGPQARGRRR